MRDYQLGLEIRAASSPAIVDRKKVNQVNGKPCVITNHAQAAGLDFRTASSLADVDRKTVHQNHGSPPVCLEICAASSPALQDRRKVNKNIGKIFKTLIAVINGFKGYFGHFAFR